MSATIQNELCYLGLVEIENHTKTFGILPEDRRRHMYILGKSGVGKSTFLENMILQDIYAGKGVCFIDPLGDSAEKIIDRIPAYRHADVVYLNPADTASPLGINILAPEHGEPSFLIASQLISLFRKIWSGAWSGRMEYFLNNAILALLEVPGNNMIGISKMFTDKQFRKFIIEHTNNLLVKSFWENEYASYSDHYKNEAAGAIINKLNQFLSNDMMRNVFGQQKSTVNFRQIMDEQKILIINLSKGRLGESNSRLLGGLIVAKLQMAAMSRTDLPEEKRKDFYLYVDEFQNIISDSFSTILSEARKYRLNLIIAHQYLGQLDETENITVKDAIFGNVGTMVSFQLGAEDAELLNKQMFMTNDEVIDYFRQLDRGQIFIKLYIQSKTVNTFMASTLPPLYSEFAGSYKEVCRLSSETYGRPREEVREEINNYITSSLIKTEDGEILRAKTPKRKRKRKNNNSSNSTNEGEVNND